MPQLDLFVYPTELYVLALVILIIGGCVVTALQYCAFLLVLRRWDFWHWQQLPTQTLFLVRVVVPLLAQVTQRSLALLHLHLLKTLRFQFFSY